MREFLDDEFERTSEVRILPVAPPIKTSTLTQIQFDRPVSWEYA